MSFGRLCPCGSGATLSGCCGPLLAGESAPTAERLMRSRYTAFVVGDSGYLERTWHPRTRPERIETDPEQRWSGLEIVSTDRGGIDDADGEVEFRASWTELGGERGVLHERSRFSRRGGRWVYVDGDIR